MTFFIYILFSFGIYASENSTDLVSALENKALAAPRCAANLSSKPGSALSRRLAKTIQATLEETGLEWLFLREDSFKLKRTAWVARNLIKHDVFVELYRIMLASASRPYLLERWLDRNLHSALIDKTEDAKEENYHSDRSYKRTQRSFALALHTTSPTIDETVRANGLLVVRVQQRTIESGVVLGQSYGGEMGFSVYFLIEGSKWSAALPMIRTLFDQADKSEAILKALRAGRIVSATEVSRGREVFSYGDNAGSLSFVDAQVLNWRSEWISSSCMYEEDGKPWAVCCVYPYAQVMHYAAAAWVKLLRSKMLSTPGT